LIILTDLFSKQLKYLWIIGVHGTRSANILMK
jgi:hypothetical protein